MTFGIEFQDTVNWKWTQINAILLVLSLLAIVFLGPKVCVGLSCIGLGLSLVSFIGSIRSKPGSPPLAFPLMLSIFHGLLIGVALFLYALFLLPADHQNVPALTKRVTDTKGLGEIFIPSSWQADFSSLPKQWNFTLKPSATEAFSPLQEVRVVAKQTAVVGVAQLEPSPTIFTVKKFWIKFHQVSVVGYKSPNILCSVSTTALPSQLDMAKDLCNALFKNLRVPATIK